jgi:hypothetical protein
MDSTNLKPFVSRRELSSAALSVGIVVCCLLSPAKSQAALTMVINTTAKTITLYGSDTVTPQTDGTGPIYFHTIQYLSGKLGGEPHGTLDLDAAYTASSGWDFDPLQSSGENGVLWSGTTINGDASHTPVTITGTGTAVSYSGTPKGFDQTLNALFEAGTLPLTVGSGNAIAITGTAPTVPEPATLGIAAILAGGAAVRRYRTRKQPTG